MNLLFAVLASTLASPQESKVDFESRVLPILRDRCYSCHEAPKTTPDGRAVKPKGGLRLDGKGWILRGSDEETVLTAGDPGKSRLYTLTVLPADHEDRMPSKGDPLTRAQTETLRLWIAQGASFGPWVGAPGGKVEPVAVVPATPAAPPAPIVSSRLTVLVTLAKGLAPAPAADLERARKAGATVEPVSPGSPLLSVSFVSKEAVTGDKELAELSPLLGNIAWLDLSRTKVSDAGLKGLSGGARLLRLDLHATAVTDAGLGFLKGLKELRSLNVYGTSVSDAGLAELEGLSSLEDLYLRETKATEAGIAKLGEKLPLAEIHSGFQAPTAEPGAATAKKKKKK
jgi:hypothetical protein